MNSLLISRYSNIYLRNRKRRYSIERDEQVTGLDRIDKSVKRVLIGTFEPIIERELLLKTFPVLNINRDSPRGEAVRGPFFPSKACGQTGMSGYREEIKR